MMRIVLLLSLAIAGCATSSKSIRQTTNKKRPTTTQGTCVRINSRGHEIIENCNITVRNN